MSLEKAYQDDIEDIKTWWAKDHKKHLIRPYSAETVASFRNSIKTEYFSSIQARKLWKILKQHVEDKTPLMTCGCVDPLLAAQMTKSGMECVYVSGGVSGASQVEEIGVDHADYPWDTVPKVVNKIFKSQMFHDRRQRQYLISLPEDKRKEFPQFDHLLPMIADGDMGFGGMTTLSKMVKLFVESGVAMFHLDDLAIGVKKFTQGIGRTIIPTSEYLKRLTTARFQLDVMGADTLLMSRLDSYQGQFITSVFDSRDHQYVMGSTNPDIDPLVVVLNKVRAEGGDVASAKLKWFKDANIMTYDEAVAAQLSSKEAEEYAELIKKDRFASIDERRAYAKKVSSKTVFFDWDAGRNTYGHYIFKTCIESVIDRAIAALPLSDCSWGRLDVPNWKDIKKFHETLTAIDPNRAYCFGYTGTYDYLKNGYTEDEFKNFHKNIAKLGAVWQVQPIFATQGVNMFTNKFTRMFKEEGIYGYVRDIQKAALDPSPYKAGTFESWGGGHYADALLDVADGCDVQLKFT